jgi:serine/threonine protein kinase
MEADEFIGNINNAENDRNQASFLNRSRNWQAENVCPNSSNSTNSNNNYINDNNINISNSGIRVSLTSTVNVGLHSNTHIQDVRVNHVTNIFNSNHGSLSLLNPLNLSSPTVISELSLSAVAPASTCLTERDTSADLLEGKLQWKLVSFDGQYCWRLVLLSPSQNIAYEAGFGEIRACTSLPIDGGAPVFVMIVRRPEKTRIGFVPVYNSFDKAPTICAGGNGAWVCIQCNDTKNHYYFFDRNNRLSANPVTSVLGNIRNDESHSYLDFQTPFGHIQGLRLDRAHADHLSGRLISCTLSGEVRGAFRMNRAVDARGIDHYVFSNEPEATVAIKIYGHGYNNPVAQNTVLGSNGEMRVPRSTRDIRHSFGKENPVKETEVLMIIKNAGGHPNVMNMQACLADEYNVYQVLDFLNHGEFYHHMYCKGSALQMYLSTQFGSNTKDTMKQIVCGLKFLHDLGIAHLDISLENIFVHVTEGQYRFVLGDFGQAVIHTRLDNGEFAPLQPYPFQYAPGKMLFFVPETFMTPLLERREYMGFKVDLWAVGMLHLIIFCRIHPFMPLASADDPRFVPTLKKWFDSVAAGAIRNMSITQVVNSESKKVFLGLVCPELHRIITSLLQYEPLLRGLSIVDGRTVPYGYHEEAFYNS